MITRASDESPQLIDICPIEQQRLTQNWLGNVARNDRQKLRFPHKVRKFHT
jgi:hypothetical protein